MSYNDIYSNPELSKVLAHVIPVVRFDDHGRQTPSPAEPESSSPDHGHPQSSGRNYRLRNNSEHQEKHPHNLRTSHSSTIIYYALVFPQKSTKN
jgi:hypothetical protein